MKKLKPALPHVIAILIFTVLASIYFAPVFSGYGLRQYDMQHAAGMAKEAGDFYQINKTETFWTNSMFGGMPTYQIAMTNHSNFLPKLEAFIFTKIMDFNIGFLVIAMISFYILLLCFEVSPWLSIVGAIAYGFASINILYLGAGHITKVHSIALLPGIIGSIIYAYRKNSLMGAALLSLFICLHVSASHIQETYYLMYLVLAIVLFEFYRFYQEKLMTKFVKISSLLIIAGVIGLLPAISGLFLTYEHGKYTTRGKSDLTINASENADKSAGLDRDYIKQYSLGTGEVWAVAVPNIKGGASGYLGNNEKYLKNVTPEFKNYVAQFSSYWGEQAGSGGAFYFGAIIFFLFVLGMVFIKDRIKWAFFISAMLAILLSMKFSFFTDLFIDHAPMFNKFRDTKMMLVLAQLAFPLLGILFIKEMFENKFDKKKLMYTMIGTIGVFVVFYIVPQLFFNFFNTEETGYFEKQISAYTSSNPSAVGQFEQFRSEIEAVRIEIFKADVLRSIFFMLLVGLFVFLYNSGKIAKKYIIITIGLLVLIDIWMVDKRYLNNDKNNGEYQSWVKKVEKNTAYKPTTSDIEILNSELKANPALAETIRKEAEKLKSENDFYKDQDINEISLTLLRFNTNYRVALLPDPFADASIAYFHKSIGGYHGAKLKRYQELVDFRLNKECQNIVSAFNSKSDTAIIGAFSHIPTLNMLNTKYIVYNPAAAPLENPNALGSAWFVKNIKIVENADAEILSLNTINPKTTAVVDKNFELQLQNISNTDSTGTIEIKSYQPNHLVYESNSGSQQVGVFSEIYYKDGWNAYLDGKPTDYFRTDYVLRGMNIPAGKHTIEFKFEPKIVAVTRNASYAGSILIIIFLAGAVVLEIRKKQA
jgi:hypothetical protein